MRRTGLVVVTLLLTIVAAWPGPALAQGKPEDAVSVYSGPTRTWSTR
jgi:hypothetical protein